MKAFELPKRLALTYYPYKPFMHRYHCIFIHIPKNAGTSILSAFNDDGGRIHAGWSEYYQSNAYFFRKYHKFAIVRDPVARFLSAYSYVLTGGNGSAKDRYLQDRVNTSASNIDQFICDILNREWLMEWEIFRPQYLFVTDHAGELTIDSLLRFETLDDDWQTLVSKYDFPDNLPHVNQSSSTDITTELSESAISRLHDLYHKDYDIFGYQK